MKIPWDSKQMRTCSPTIQLPENNPKTHTASYETRLEKVD